MIEKSRLRLLSWVGVGALFLAVSQMLGGWDPSNNGYAIGGVVMITLFQALNFVYCGQTQGKPLQDFARILTPFSLVAGVGILLGQWVSTHYASDGSDLLLLFGLMGGSVVLWSSGLMISYARSVQAFRARHAELVKSAESDTAEIEVVDQFLAEPTPQKQAVPLKEKPKAEPPTSS
ncbi:MAG: hypothetical protein ACI9VR_000398 [Cognaticolwellia sp.]